MKNEGVVVFYFVSDNDFYIMAVKPRKDLQDLPRIGEKVRLIINLLEVFDILHDIRGDKTQTTSIFLKETPCKTNLDTQYLPPVS